MSRLPEWWWETKINLEALYWRFYRWWHRSIFGKTIIVRPGESISAACEKAKYWDTVKIMPGIYEEYPIVIPPGVTLLGGKDGDRWGGLIRTKTIELGGVIEGLRIEIMGGDHE